MTIRLVIPEKGPETSAWMKAREISLSPATAEELIGLFCLEGDICRSTLRCR